MTFSLLIILILSIVIHEVAHGVAALWQGDETAKREGRLTMNPIPHIDIFGSILLPFLLAMSGSPIMFGWAKPVPVNPYNFRNQKWGEALVAFAGPFVNILLAIISLFLLKTMVFSGSYIPLLEGIIVINIVLAIFNLIPIPPLDGSKILFAFLPHRFYKFKTWMERQGFIIGLIMVLIFWTFIDGFVGKLLNFLL